MLSAEQKHEETERAAIFADALVGAFAKSGLGKQLGYSLRKTDNDGKRQLCVDLSSAQKKMLELLLVEFQFCMDQIDLPADAEILKNLHYGYNIISACVRAGRTDAWNNDIKKELFFGGFAFDKTIHGKTKYCILGFTAIQTALLNIHNSDKFIECAFGAVKSFEKAFLFTNK